MEVKLIALGDSVPSTKVQLVQRLDSRTIPVKLGT